jgi:hypothetical protein
MAKPFEEHEWEIEVDAGFVHFRAKDQCNDPHHGPECAVSKFYSLLSDQRPRTAQVKDDMGIRYVGSYDPLDIPDCDCDAGEPCICHHLDGINEVLSFKLDVKGLWRYSYDAYSGESDAWVEVTEVRLSA